MKRTGVWIRAKSRKVAGSPPGTNGHPSREADEEEWQRVGPNWGGAESMRHALGVICAPGP